MDGYEELAIAILKQSVADYKNALKKNYKQRISYFEMVFRRLGAAFERRYGRDYY